MSAFIRGEIYCNNVAVLGGQRGSVSVFAFHLKAAQKQKKISIVSWKMWKAQPAYQGYRGRPLLIWRQGTTKTTTVLEASWVFLTLWPPRREPMRVNGGEGEVTTRIDILLLRQQWWTNLIEIQSLVLLLPR